MIRPIQCSNCGKVEPLICLTQSPIAQLIRKEKLCYECAFWMQYAKTPYKDGAIVNGCLYKFSPTHESTKRKCLKNKFFAVDVWTKELVYSSQRPQFMAKVPARFKKQFPDKYKFISLRTYKILRERHNECLSKGCWDRYYCYWYNASKAEPSTPWNEIPHYHKSGGEGCESFIDKTTMYDVEYKNNQNK